MDTDGTGGIVTGPAAAVPVSRAAPVPVTANERPHIRITRERQNRLRLTAYEQESEAVAVLKRDYYEVLGISPKADDDAIRRAFHALARDWHPDVADAPDAEARFRELAEAYSVLSKRESRLLYDRYGYRGRGNQGFDDAL